MLNHVIITDSDARSPVDIPLHMSTETGKVPVYYIIFNASVNQKNLVAYHVNYIQPAGMFARLCVRSYAKCTGVQLVI